MIIYSTLYLLFYWFFLLFHHLFLFLFVWSYELLIFIAYLGLNSVSVGWNGEQESRKIESKNLLKINNSVHIHEKINKKHKDSNYQNDNNDNFHDFEKEKKYPPVVLSKFEIEAFNKAKERQINRIKNGQEQSAAGKIFSGFGFSAKSKEIIFQDFCIGKKYNQKVFLTNTSFGLNSVRLVNLNDNVIDFFNIKYEKVGRISAGVGINIEITFSPKINEDIHTGSFYFLFFIFLFYFFLVLIVLFYSSYLLLK